jgi:hypothetical protein
MKREVTNFITRCLEYPKVNVEHKNSAGLLQPLPILGWKWEFVMIDFIIKFPRTSKQHDYIIVVVYKLTEASPFYFA